MTSLIHTITTIYRKSPLLKASLWYSSGQLLIKLLSFGAIFVFTRILTPEEYGTASIFISWTLLLATTIPLNVDFAIVRSFYDHKDVFPQFVSSVMTLGLLSSAVVLTVLALLPAIWIEALFNLDKLVVLLAGLTAVFMVIFRINQRVWQVTERYQFYVVSHSLAEVSKIALSVILILLPVWTAGGQGAATGRILGYALVYAMIGLVVLWQRVRIAPLKIDLSYWRYALTFALPVLPHIVAGMVLVRFDQLMIDAYIGRAEAGIYSFSYQLGSVVSMLYVAINTAWMPWLFRKMEAEAFSTIRQRSTQYLLAFTGATALLILAGPLVVYLIVPPSYSPAVFIVPVIMVGSFLQMLYNFPVNIEIYQKRTGFMAVGTVITAGLNVVLNMLFIPRFGYLAAAWTTLFSYLVLLLIHLYLTNIRLKVRGLYNVPLMFICAAAMFVLMIIVMGLSG